MGFPAPPSSFGLLMGLAPLPRPFRGRLSVPWSSLYSQLSSRLSSSHISALFLSCALSKSSRAWLRSIPTPSSFLSDREFSLASRLRLGLPPSDSLPRVCRCSARLSEDPAHFMSCMLLTSVATVRHNRIVRHLSTLVQRAGGVTYVEPRY